MNLNPDSEHYFPALLIAVILFLFSADLPLRAETTVPSRISLLPNREYAEVLLQGIRAARSSIVCSFYLFKTGVGLNDLPRRIAEELISARRRGIAVTVILEKNSEYDDRLNDDNRRTSLLLLQGGVGVFFDSPMRTSHEKVVVIDRRFIYLGSHNLTQAALLHNNELSVLIDSPTVAKDVLSFLESTQSK